MPGSTATLHAPRNTSSAHSGSEHQPSCFPRVPLRRASPRCRSIRGYKRAPRWGEIGTCAKCFARIRMVLDRPFHSSAHLVARLSSAVPCSVSLFMVTVLESRATS